MTSDLSTLTALLGALSVASERLVEIVKNVVPGLKEAKTDERAEGLRQALLQLLSIVAGIATASIANIAVTLPGQNRTLSVVAFGVLASGGSGFWNSIQTYVVKLKDLTKEQAKKEEKAIELTTAQAEKERALTDLARRSIQPPI
jgi:hypothetical protein